jgi:hypothetical protein
LLRAPDDGKNCPLCGGRPIIEAARSAGIRLPLGHAALGEGEEPRDMSCLEDKPQQWDRPGKYRCKKCAATADKKKKICKPAKIDKKK